MYKTVSTALQSRTFNRVFPVLILGVLATMLWANLNKSVDPATLVADVKWVPFAVLISLSFLNLFLETEKWLALIGKSKISRSLGFKSVLYGMCSGILTPNRVGEFLGRQALLPKRLRKKGAVMTLTGSVIQGVITILFGLIGLFTFPVFPKLNTSFYLDSKALIVTAIGIILSLAVFAHRDRLKRYLRAWLQPLKRLSKKQMLKASGFGILRYLVFSSQFAIALFAFGYSGSLLVCYSGIFLLYFCQSYVPFTAFGELGVREVLAVLIFGNLMPNPLLALTASLLVWFANIGLPVLAGTILMKLSKTPVFGNH